MDRYVLKHSDYIKSIYVGLVTVMFMVFVQLLVVVLEKGKILSRGYSLGITLLILLVMIILIKITNKIRVDEKS